MKLQGWLPPSTFSSALNPREEKWEKQPGSVKPPGQREIAWEV